MERSTISLGNDSRIRDVLSVRGLPHIRGWRYLIGKAATLFTRDVTILEAQAEKHCRALRNGRYIRDKIHMFAG